jgi:sugar O-acyltransferase (sialic acid O-acetyltransferase NeuD family)
MADVSRADVIVVGASGHAKVVIDIIERVGRQRIVGLVDREGTGHRIWDYDVLGTTDALPAIAARMGVSGYVLGVGSNSVRRRVTELMGEEAFEMTLFSAVHPSAVLGREVEIGAGTVVMAGATVNASCRIGRGCVINTGASLDHDGVMEDYSSLAPGAVVGGGCHIGPEAWIGIGATIVQQIRVGARATVGAGSTVLRDVDPDVVVIGTPARIKRNALP